MVRVTNYVKEGRVAARHDDDLTDALVQLSFEVQRILAAAGAREGLSLPQVRLLGVLSDRSVPVLQLGALLGLEKSSVSGLVDRAERAGLLSRATSPADGRVVLVTLSAQGQGVAARVRAEVRDGLAAVAAAAGVDGAQRRTLATLGLQWASAAWGGRTGGAS